MHREAFTGGTPRAGERPHRTAPPRSSVPPGPGPEAAGAAAAPQCQQGEGLPGAIPPGPPHLVAEQLPDVHSADRASTPPNCRQPPGPRDTAP